MHSILTIAITWEFLLCAVIPFFLQAHDSLRHPDYIAKQIIYNNKYDFVDYNSNYFILPQPTTLLRFFEALGRAGHKKVKVVHIGDSHIQADIVTGHIRNTLQTIFGAGGRGFIFPYAAAGTHPGYDYFTYARGKWEYARNVFRDPILPLGLSGVTIRTTDLGAGFKIAFNQFYKKDNNTLLKIYCKKGIYSLDLLIKYDHFSDTLHVSCQDTL
ncbi:MAG: hypothetical protein RML72_12715, partial [Bacteroidia bacterium]|nr:hypothetical protein [Bacteroidia bacterium]MDW8159721.1 hypothetical protein [Bacteroidia bacterium]